MAVHLKHAFSVWGLPRPASFYVKGCGHKQLARKNWGALGPRHLGMGAWVTHKTGHFPHMCHHAEFGRSTSKGVDIM